MTLVGDPDGACDGAVAGRRSSAVDEVAASLELLFDEIGELLPDATGLLGPVLDSLRSGPVVTVTGFGRDQLGRVLRGQGLPVPMIGDLADAAPAQFLQALSGHRPELVMSASGKDHEAPLRRIALPLVIAVVSQAAEPMIEEWRQDRWLAVPVGLGLAAATGAAQPLPGHLLWMAVDMLSTGLGDDEFADLVHLTGVADLLVEHSDDRKLAQQLRRSLAPNKLRKARG